MMRAKMRVQAVTVPYTGAEKVQMFAVCGNTNERGEREDNTYAIATPTATLEMTIANPALVGKIKEGMTFYVDFTEHIE